MGSESGVDWRYAVAVPEPTEFVLLLCALPLVWWASRRKL